MELLEERGWSQGELARRTALTRSAISQLCQGSTEPSLSTIRKLAVAFDITEGDIIDGTHAPDSPDEGATALTPLGAVRAAPAAVDPQAKAASRG